MGSSATQLRQAAEQTLGQPVLRIAPLARGTGGDTYALTLGSGQRVLIKVGRQSPAQLLTCEAAGLAWLAQANAISVPHVLAVRRDPPAMIALDFIEAAPRAPQFDATLGRQLAALHQHHPRAFGLDHDNFVGPLPQANGPASSETFAAFYRERRLLPLLHLLAHDSLDQADARDLERIATTLEDRIPVEPPARLHGDLWAGNLMVGPAGEPVVIDPSVYGGHREIDLAMMRLFGGFGAPVFDAYHEAYPLAPGWRARVPLMQLYPLLVHVVLFGPSYVGQLRAAIAAVR